jgi:predicted transposase/invertase (TIGR01784 family)
VFSAFVRPKSSSVREQKTPGHGYPDIEKSKKNTYLCRVIIDTIMAHYLDPKNDLTFKRVFGEHKHLCMSLINSMLPLEKPIVSIEYQTGELIPELANVLRHTIVDVRCTDEAGQQFIVEMQMYWTESFKSRVLLNASKAYVTQLDKAEKIKLLKPVYALNFVNDTFEKSPDMQNEYYHHYKIVNVKDTGKQIKGLEFLFIELPKYHPENRAEKKLRDLWLRFLTEINESTEDVPRELLDNDLTSEAVGYMERGAYTKEQLFTYDKWKIDILTERGMVDDAIEEGMIKGEAIGAAKEREKGEAQRKADRENIALNLLKHGMSVDDTSEMTGLPKSQIEDLKKRLGL